MASSFFDLVQARTAAADAYDNDDDDDDDDDDDMSFTAVSLPSEVSCADLCEQSGELDIPMSLQSVVTSVFGDLANDDALTKAGRFLQMSWYVMIQLLTFSTLKA